MLTDIFTSIKQDLNTYIEKDISDNPFPHLNISDCKFVAQWAGNDELLVWKMFQLIKVVEYAERKNLIKEFYTLLNRSYNDQTLKPGTPEPIKVGRAVDKVVSNGVRHIGELMTGQTNTIFPWMIADQSTTEPTYGDDQTDIDELARVNCVTDTGFLDPMMDGWNASGGFGRGTPTGNVSGSAMGSTSISATSKIFDRSVFPLDDRIEHVQNNDSFTLSALYILTSI